MKTVVAFCENFAIPYGKSTDLGAQAGRFRANFFEEFEEFAVGGGEGHLCSIDYRVFDAKCLLHWFI